VIFSSIIDIPEADAFEDSDEDDEGGDGEGGGGFFLQRAQLFVDDVLLRKFSQQSKSEVKQSK